MSELAKNKLEHAEDARAVVVDAETIAFVDVTAADMLRQLAGELADRGVQLFVAHDIGQVRDVLHTEDERLYPTVEEAVARAR